MTAEEKQKRYKEQSNQKQMTRKQMRKRRQKVRFFLYMSILFFLCFCSFFLGKCLGEKTGRNSTSGDWEAFGEWADSLEEVSLEMDEIQESHSEEKAEGFQETGNDMLILVNKDNCLPEDYEPELVTLPDGTNRAAVQAYEPLMAMLQAGKRAGLNFVVCSSYRDVEYQRRLFEEDVNALMRQGYSYEQAYEEVAKETMPPGYSEHSTGLAFDIVALDYQMLDAGQELTAENQWLREHCAEYGFILRYPEGKEDVTQISYESWHFRYVGAEAAEYIMENGITLEEYVKEIG